MQNSSGLNLPALPISDTARAKVAEDYPGMAEPLSEGVAELLTILEGIDAKYAAFSEPTTVAEAAEFIAADPRLQDPHWAYIQRRNYEAEREPYRRMIARLTAYYMPPIIVHRAEDGSLTPLTPLP